MAAVRLARTRRRPARRAAADIGPSLRRATPDDARTLTRIARAAKASWGYPEDLLRLWADELRFEPRHALSREAWCVLLDGVVVGFAAVSFEERRPELTDLWVEPSVMKRGLGTLLLECVLRAARAGGATEVELSSDPNAEPFYLRRGAVRIGESASRPAGRRIPRLLFRLVDG